MSQRTGRARKIRIAAAILLATLASTGCINVGQAVKTLGKNSVGGTGTPGTDSDSFSITVAYRDPVNDAATPNRTVSLQGPFGLSSASLATACGATGASCACDFYRTATDASPVTATVAGVSSTNNSLSCTIPGSATCGISGQICDGQIKATPSGFYVRLRRTDDSTKTTGLISIATTLKIEDVLGPNLSKTYVRGVYKYSCNRTFFEGEGVSASNVLCTPGQHLGVITAAYTFYIYRSATESISPFADSAFPGDICKRNNFLKIQCSGNTPDLRYGLYNPPKDGQAGPFVVGITMTSAPEGKDATSSFGFAALPDGAGNCPTGLIKVRPYVAQPASIIQGSIDGTNPPSSFINSGNSLNDTVVEQSAPSPFLVNRQPNVVRCDATSGDCTSAVFGGQVTVQTVAYAPVTPVVCVIPPKLLEGLF